MAEIEIAILERNALSRNDWKTRQLSVAKLRQWKPNATRNGAVLFGSLLRAMPAASWSGSIPSKKVHWLTISRRKQHLHPSNRLTEHQSYERIWPLCPCLHLSDHRFQLVLGSPA